MHKRTSKTPISGITPKVRESKRVKNVSLKISERGELTVVIPHGFNHSLIPGILQQKQSWIDRVQRQIEEERKLYKPEPLGQLPKQVLLRAIGQEWSLGYKPTADSEVTIEECGKHKLMISGDIGNYLLCTKVLQKWIFHEAHKHLVPWLRVVSDKLELPFSRVIVRNQRTRWGSCSQRKSISINQKLLFFPSPLVRYIFIHELCHTVHLNHSPEFWALVQEKEPRFKQFRKEMRTVRKYIPDWSEAPRPKVGASLGIPKC